MRNHISVAMVLFMMCNTSKRAIKMGFVIAVMIFCLAIDTSGREKQKIRGRPATLEQTYAYLDSMFDDTAAYGFMTMPEEVATVRLHMSLGMWIRNNWGLWQTGRLAHYFIDKGIGHPDNMSAIILTSYHRYLNKKPVDLEGQIEQYKEWDKNPDLMFTQQMFPTGGAVDSALIDLFPVGDTILKSVYAKYKKGRKKHGSGVRALAVVKEHRHGEMLLIQIIDIQNKPYTIAERKLGDIYETRPYDCSLLPPRNWHR